MPLNLSLCITTPKFVSVCINTVLLMNYLRLAKRRYMDEWIGSLIYVVGDIVCLIIGVLTRFVEPGDENEQAYLFISYFVFTRTLLVSFPPILSRILSGRNASFKPLFIRARWLLV